MAAYPPKRMLSELKKRPSRLCFDEQHKFRIKSQHSLSHLRESREYLPCVACTKEADRRHEAHSRPQSSYIRSRSTPPPSYEQRPSTATRNIPYRSPPTPADLERLSRPKQIPPERLSDNCNWNNFIQKKSKYGIKIYSSYIRNFNKYLLFLAIKTPYGLCDLTYGQENTETRPPFINYGSRYDDKQNGKKRTFNSLAIHVCLIKIS